MRKTLLFLIAILVTSSWSAQCDGNRYQSFVFSDFTVTTDIEYGSNVDLNGAPETLLMDVYTPDGDIETSRPLIIVCHGGYFLGGDKAESDVVPLVRRFCENGLCGSIHQLSTLV
jgi:para-nitrobenzyl esterase